MSSMILTIESGSGSTQSALGERLQVDDINNVSSLASLKARGNEIFDEINVNNGIPNEVESLSGEKSLLRRQINISCMHNRFRPCALSFVSRVKASRQTCSGASPTRCQGFLFDGPQARRLHCIYRRPQLTCSAKTW